LKEILKFGSSCFHSGSIFRTNKGFGPVSEAENQFTYSIPAKFRDLEFRADWSKVSRKLNG
jgi:hypothetical protein